MTMIQKLLSGRFILTVVCAIVFMWYSIIGKLSTEAIAAILASVFQAYFNRTDRSNNGGKNEKLS